MTSLRNLAVHLLLSAVGMTGVAQAVPLVEHVVYGNLGSDASDPLDLAGSNSFGSGVASTQLLSAQPFTTPSGTTQLELVSVIAGLSGTAPVNVEMAIYTSTGSPGSPGAAVISSLPVSVSGTSTYTFTFPSLYTLSPSTTYFVVASTVGTARWWQQEINPEEQNSSGYNNLSLLPSQRFNGSTWSTASSNAYAVSIQAVPEPSTIVPACVGIVGGLAYMGRSCRRRRSAADDCSEV